MNNLNKKQLHIILRLLSDKMVVQDDYLLIETEDLHREDQIDYMEELKLITDILYKMSAKLGEE